MIDQQHPLTHARCEKIASFFLRTYHDGAWKSKYEAIVELKDMRNAYDEGFSDAIHCFQRAGIAPYTVLYKVQERFYEQDFTETPRDKFNRLLKNSKNEDLIEAFKQMEENEGHFLEES